jgi:hypothetical protein
MQPGALSWNGSSVHTGIRDDETHRPATGRPRAGAMTEATMRAVE